jgi:hypothetical protein
MDPFSLEWWHVVIGIFGVVSALLVRGLTAGFRGWSKTLTEFKDAMHQEVAALRKDHEVRMNHLERRFDIHDERQRQFTIDVERRVTWVEAQVVSRQPFRPGSVEHHHHHDDGGQQ